MIYSYRSVNVSKNKTRRLLHEHRWVRLRCGLRTWGRTPVSRGTRGSFEWWHEIQPSETWVRKRDQSPPGLLKLNPVRFISSSSEGTNIVHSQWILTNDQTQAVKLTQALNSRQRVNLILIQVSLLNNFIKVYSVDLDTLLHRQHAFSLLEQILWLVKLLLLPH